MNTNEFIKGVNWRAGDLLCLSSVAECCQVQPDSHSPWAWWMECPGKVAAHPVTDSACGRDGGAEEGGSHFQKLLQLPEPSAASNP